jgi:hypothetical protein
MPKQVIDHYLPLLVDFTQSIAESLASIAESIAAQRPPGELTDEQVKSLVAWANANTTGFGPAFTAAFGVAKNVAAKDAAK